MRDNINRELRTVDRVDREASPVDADRSLAGDIARQLSWRFVDQADALTVGSRAHKRPDTIDVAAHNMPAETRGGLHRFFEVDPRAVLQLTQARAVHSFVRNIGGKMRSIEFHHGKTAAIHGDAVA